MTLIDTPGLNDPDAQRTDKNIQIEMIKDLSGKLYDPKQGISSLNLCVMPNAAHRIMDTTVKAMNIMFLMFGSLDERINVKLHPKYFVVINNVSKYGDDYDPVAVLNDPNYVPQNTSSSLSREQRISDIKI